jgi:hypothetical protein
MADSKKLLVYGDQEKNKSAKNQDPSTYVCTRLLKKINKSEVICTGELPKLFRQLGEKYFDYSARTTPRKIFRLLAEPIGQSGEKDFDYFVFNIVDYGVNCGLLRSGAHHRALAQTISNARGLDINSPRSAEITLKTCDFVDISNAMIPTTLGGSTTTSLMLSFPSFFLSSFVAQDLPMCLLHLCRRAMTP